MDTSTLINLRPIDILGLKNFRIFDDKGGFLEELSAINILTGANNSGKSSVVKALQMLRNSIREYKYPFDLDLNQQEHLLGDFDNILYNRKNRNLEITLPYLFMGMKNFSVSLTFESSSLTNTYDAKLRGLNITDRTDDQILFSFQYREATKAEKENDKADYEKGREEYRQKKSAGEKINLYNADEYYNFEDPLAGYIDWKINQAKLKHYLTDLKELYGYYLEQKKGWTADSFKRVDDVAKDMYVIPSSFIRSFQRDADLEKWTNFLNHLEKDQEISGSKRIGDRDFEPDDYLLPPSEIEHIFFYNTKRILKEKLRWTEIEKDEDGYKYSVIEQCFKLSWEGLIQRISSIEYVSNIKEENSRSYNAASNSPFIKLLRDYFPHHISVRDFMNKYLKEFEIGKKISVEINPKYQSIMVSITTLEGEQRELVDFGYGIKQLVLIMMQICVLAQKNKREEHIYDHEDERINISYVPSLLIIEEPESNLHPKWQSRLADMFAEANREFNIQMIIETHSEYLIRKFQTLVASKTVAAENVKIFYLRNPNLVKHGKKQVESLLIQRDGGIDFEVFDQGFFDENYNLTMSLLNVQREKFLQDFEDLKKNKQESEEKIIELQKKIDAYTEKKDLAKYQQMIHLQFNTSKFDPKTVTYLVSGQYLLANIDPGGDFSPVIIQYGRAIENELKRVFLPINPAEKWVLGPMQGSLEKFKGIPANTGACSKVDYLHVPGKMASMFNNPLNLKIEILNDLRVKRNEAGHAGHTKTEQQAVNYINDAVIFLNSWIAELK